MASKTSTNNPLTTVYERRIGTPSTGDEARGYWTFVLGLILAFAGIGWLITTNLTGPVPQGPVVLVGLGLVLLIAGPTIRLPLQSWATYLVYVGAALSLVGVVWFVTVYPGWRPQAQSVIGLYSLGLLVIAVGGAFVPILTDRADLEAEVSDLHAELDELREAVTNSEANEAELDERIATLQNALADTESKNVELEKEVTQLQDDVADTEADEADLAAVIREHQTSQAQFELYTDKGERYRWRLRHDNGNIIADSAQGYASRQGVQQGLNAVKRDAFGAAVLDLDKMDIEDEDEVESDGQPAVTEQDQTQATFETYEDRDGKYRWRLRHDNDNIIADSSQGYVSKASRDDGLESIRHYVQSANYLHIDPTAFELYRDEGGEYRWRLLHENGNILADSGQGYASRQGAQQGVDSVRKNVGADGNAEFEVYEDSAGEYRFRLVHRNENIIADGGQGYASENGAHDAVGLIREYASEAHVLDIGGATFEIYEDEGGDWRWRLRHRNGNIMADGSQGYATRTGAEDGLNSVKQNAPEAEIEAVDS